MIRFGQRLNIVFNLPFYQLKTIRVAKVTRLTPTHAHTHTHTHPMNESYSALSSSSSQSSSSSSDDELNNNDDDDELNNNDDDELNNNNDDELNELDTTTADAFDIAKLVQTVERGLQASVFQVEPVTHITYQLLFVDNERNVERIERHVMQLQQANVIDKFDIARIIKRARGTRYRLTALIVYNVDLTLKELIRGVDPHTQSRFTTTLLSLSNFTLRPTLACFHSVNSVHVVFSRTSNTSNYKDSNEFKRHISIHPSALMTRSRKRH